LRLLLLVLGIMPGHAEKRVALVIGNGAYRHLRPLTNPPNDARDLAKTLESLGFEVDLGVDLGLADMQRKVTEFARRARTADVALAFFGGHGVQAPDPSGSAQPVNYLLPVDADIKDAADLGFLTTARDIVSRLALAAGVRILILDACRDNPIPQQLADASSNGRSTAAARGLGPPAKTSGTLIAFSTQPDQIADDGRGRNSPFVAALLRHISEPGLDVRLLFTDVRGDVIRASKGGQTPETWDSLDGRFSFKEAAKPASFAATAKPTGTVATPASPPAAPPGGPAPSKPAETVTAAVFPVSGPCGPGAVTASFASRCAAPLAAAEERGLKPKDTFKECDNCPEMVVVPAGSFTMGSPFSEKERLAEEGPQRTVTIGKPFAVGKFHITVDQFAAFVAETGYDAGSKCNTFFEAGTGNWVEKQVSWRNPGFTQGGSHPAVCVNWNDAKNYVAWLAQKTGKTYRLLTEAQWEYAARARTEPGAYPRNSFGNDEKDLCRYGNGADQTAKNIGATSSTAAPCNDGYAYTSPAGSFAANGFGLYDMQGNAWQLTEDCWHDSYAGAPSDDRAWTFGGCGSRVVRGGAWNVSPRNLRAASRIWHSTGFRGIDVGFRVGRTLTP
jgi:formylglycine-generating enzyme required for sulfatase activity